MSSSDEEELLLPLALSCKRKWRRWWIHEINEKRERLGEYHCLCVELQSHEDFRTFSINFSVNSSAIPYCPPGKSVSKTHMSAARRDLDWSAASARLVFDGDYAFLHNAVRTPSRRGHRSLSASAARTLCGRTLIRPLTTITAVRLSNRRQKFLHLRQSLYRNSNSISHKLTPHYTMVCSQIHAPATLPNYVHMHLMNKAFRTTFCRFLKRKKVSSRI